jgi:hypothetical protein
MDQKMKPLLTQRCELIRQGLETTQGTRFGALLSLLGLCDLAVEGNKLVDRVKQRLKVLLGVDQDKPVPDRVAQAEIAQED